MTCGDHLMETDWQEGFTCTLPEGHPPPHRDAGHEANNESTDDQGRKYGWIYEWWYMS